MSESQIAIVGGGIFGTAAAEALARVGYSVALYERGSLHHATSNNSHQIIHGGLRYLQQCDFRRLARSLAAKNYCLENLSEYVAPLRCALGISGRGMKRASILATAGIGYGFISTLFGFPTEWNGIASKEQLALNQFFKNCKEKKFFQWSDARILNPSELAAHLVRSFIDCGGVVHENQEVVSIQQEADEYVLQIADGRKKKANLIILCLGPWANCIELPVPLQHDVENWALAFNLVLHRNLVGENALGFESADTRQILFFSPRGVRVQDNGSINGTELHTAVGTWYIPCTEQGNEPLHVPDSHVEQALQEINRTLAPQQPLHQSDIARVECGVLPVRRFCGDVPQFFGSDRIITNAGIASVLSTKYTTFSQTAEELVEWVSRHPKVMTPKKHEGVGERGEERV